jgi:beta-lactam-binding protein with PASTA domain
MSPTQAKLRLQQQFFQLGTVRYALRTDEDRSEAFVKDQTPAPGSALPRGAKVRLDVSILPHMPDLKGRSVEDAQRYIELLGLKVGSIRYEQSDDLLPWSVLDQSVPPGRRIQAGDTVDLVLSHL